MYPITLATNNRRYRKGSDLVLPKEVEFFTIQMHRFRLLSGTNILFKDVTWKSGDRIFAPTAEILFPYKNGNISEKEYTRAFNRITHQRFVNDPLPWIRLLQEGRVALACYCRAGKFCHRCLLIDIFRSICNRYQIRFYYGGEIE